ncbi:MAG: ABC transporter substrate-binding protein [Candidatus Sumerlaeaceae bacterium]|nr:ABC transporter substrate-binding protein [Candidatus Sumerlaeaceae bacterium]
MMPERRVLWWILAIFALIAPVWLSGCAKKVRVRELDDVLSAGVLRWGSDEAGGAPYEFRDPQNPSQRVGFEVDIAEEIGRRLGLKIEFVQTDWAVLIPALQRGDFDMAMSGIEITPERKQVVDFVGPYYVYLQQLVVRADDTQTSSLNDLVGKKVGTLNNTAAERILRNTPGIEVVSYDDNVRPYDDLAIGRIAGVLLDLPIALYYAKPNPKLRFAGEPFGEGHYGIAVNKQCRKLRDALQRIIEEMASDGTLKRILEKWELWNEAQKKLPAELQKK